ncbi:hypothetical protein Agub_g2075, partial [Astrephomene gubernaculifera]
MTGHHNPYLSGYGQHPRRHNTERNRADAQPSSIQPLHPMIPAAAATRTSSAAITTSAPLMTAELQSSMMSLSLTPNAGGGNSSIDILVPGQALGPSGSPAHAESPTPGSHIHQPGTFSGPSFPFGAAAAQPAPPEVEITISAPHDEDQGPGHLTGSHLEGLTVQQILDLDIDALAVKIDRHHSQTKKAMLDHFMETKARLMQAKNEMIEEEKRACNARLATKEEELNLMKAELEGTRIKAQRTWDTLSRACDAYGQAKENRRRTMLLFQLFYGWREQAMALAQRRRRMERAERWNELVHLKRNVFRAWFRQTAREHRVTLNNRYIDEVANAKRLIHEHYQGQINDLKRMLADAQVQLEQEAEARSRLEDNMKRAFMRGVCALNIEAMNIMKRGAPPGGVNPFPTTVPAGGEPHAPEAAQGNSSASNEAYGSQPANVLTQADASNVDMRGSITFSPKQMSVATAAASHGGSYGYSAGGAGSSVVGSVAPSSGLPAGASTSITGAV